MNAKTPFALTLPAGAMVASSSFTSDTGFRALGSGWNLIATGDNPTPTSFNQALSATPPAAGSLPLNLTTLWAWDAAKSGWYFWAPSMVGSGGLTAYLTSKGYLDFTALSTTPAGTLSPTTGFWVNRP